MNEWISKKEVLIIFVELTCEKVLMGFHTFLGMEIIESQNSLYLFCVI